MGRVLALLTLTCTVEAFATAPALVYHDLAHTVTVSADEAKLAEAVRRVVRSSRTVAPKLDTHLVQAARRLAVWNGSPRDALIASGVSDAFALPLNWTALDGTAPLEPVELLLEAEVRESRATHYGVGVVHHGGARRVGVVFVRRGAELGRFPRRVTPGDRFLLTGRLDPNLASPGILLATPDGAIREIASRIEHGVFWARVPFDAGAGRYHVEVQAKGRYGEQVLNLMEVYAFHHDEALAAPVVRLRPPVTPVATRSEAEDRSVILINRARRQAGLPMLRASAALRAEARAHSEDMADGRWFGHVSPTRGDLRRRLERAGFARVLARENVALASSPEVAHAELVRSPSHLRNFLDPDVTHVGVGAYGRPGPQPVYTFTQIFATLR